MPIPRWRTAMHIQSDIDYLISVFKIVDGARSTYKAPRPGEKLEVKLMAPASPSLKFTLSIAAGSRSSVITLKINTDRKTTLQTRHFANPLIRIDLDAKAIHTNPDGQLIKGEHIHIATSEYGDKFAWPLKDQDIIPQLASLDNVPEIFEAFREYCHIEDTLRVDWSLGV